MCYDIIIKVKCKVKVIIFYGTDCNDKTAWIPWFQQMLTNQGIECVIPKLPTPKNQTYQTWSNITKNLDLQEDDIVVGWSTGAIFSVRYLYENQIKVKKLVLVSGFNNYIGNVPEVDNINKDFFMQNVDMAKNIAREIVCIKSDNDPFITQQALNDFAKKLHAKVINVANGGHFNSNAGYNEFPQLLTEIIGRAELEQMEDDELEKLLKEKEERKRKRNKDFEM